MKTKFVVIEGDGSVSWSAKTDAAESFPTFAAAEKRAIELAKCEPGDKIGIYTLHAEVTAPVGKVTTTQR